MIASPPCEACAANPRAEISRAEILRGSASVGCRVPVPIPRYLLCLGLNRFRQLLKSFPLAPDGLQLPREIWPRVEAATRGCPFGARGRPREAAARSSARPCLRGHYLDMIVELMNNDRTCSFVWDSIPYNVEQVYRLSKLVTSPARPLETRSGGPLSRMASPPHLRKSPLV